MKEAHVRTRWLKAAVSVHGPLRSPRPDHRARKGSWSRTRMSGSG